MQKSFKVLILSAVVLMAQGAAAEKPSIAVRVDPQTVALGESFNLEIEIKSSGLGRPDIQLPPLDDFDILSKSLSTPMQFSFSFGSGSKSSTTTSYSFVLAPRVKGELKIGKVIVTHEGKKYSSRPVVVSVLEGSGAPLTGAQSSDTQAQSEDDSSEALQNLEGAKYDEVLFVQTVLSKDTVFVGEQLTLELYVYAGARLSDVNVSREPGLDAFWSEDLLDRKKRISFKDIVVGGRLFKRAMMRREALFPLKAGKVDIAPAVVEALIGTGGFFGRTKKVTRVGVPASVEVLDLPEEGRPDGFSPGNVGNYRLNAEVSSTRVKQGEPVTLKVSIEGVGNVRSLKFDVFDELEGFRVYEPEVTDAVAARSMGVSGRKTLDILLIPQEEGEYTIPSMRLDFFNPDTKEYVNLSTPSFDVTVLQGENRTAAPAPAPQRQAETESGTMRRAQVDEEALSLRSIVSRVDLSMGSQSLLYRQWWYIVLLFGPYLILLILYASVWFAGRQKEVDTKIRWKRAFAIARNRMKKADEKRASSGEFFSAVSKALVGYLEDRMEVSLGSDLSSTIRRKMEKRGYSEELQEAVMRELEALDYARFASSAAADSEMDACISRVNDLLKDLDRVKPRRNISDED